MNISNNINLNIKNVPFKGMQNSPITSPISEKNNAVNIKNVNYTPDYNIKTPQRYVKIGTYDFPANLKGHFYKLENGQKVVIVPKEGPTVVKTYVNVGSMNEKDEQRGISHFIEHSLFNGSDGLKEGEFFETVNKIGGTTNASTSFATTDYYINSNLLKETDLEEEIKIHASMLETPKFTNEMIEKEKGPVTSEISMINDSTCNFTINNSIKNLYNIKTTSKDMIGGTISNINNLTKDKVVQYYKENYYPSNMVTVITGETTPDEAINLVAKYFQSKAKPQKQQDIENFNQITKPVREDIISPKATKTYISLAFSGPKNNATKDKVITDAFKNIMFNSETARISKALDRIQSDAEFSVDRLGTKPNSNNVITINSVTTEQSCEKILNTIYNEIQNLSTNPPTDDEMKIMKKQLEVAYAGLFEHSDSINSLIGHSMLDNDLEYVLNYNEIINKLTPNDIVDYAKKYFDLNKASITVVHPEKKVKNNKVSQVNFGSSKSRLIDTNKVNKYVLPNNIELYTNNIDTNLCVVNLNLSTSEEKDFPIGTSLILNLMLKQGSNKQSQEEFYNNLYKQGITLDIVAENDFISAYTKCLPENINDSIKGIKELLLSPNLSEENFKYAKAQLKEYLEIVSKDTKDGLISEMFKGQKYSVLKKDIKNNIDNITLNDVKNLYNNLILNSQGVCTISAPLNNENTKNRILSELCMDFPKLKPVGIRATNNFKPVDATKTVIQTHEKSQAQIELGYKYKTNENIKDSVTFILLNTILGGTASSRLFNDLREKQKLAYQVNSKMYSFDDTDVLSLFIKTTTDDKSSNEKTYDNLQKSIDGFNKHINKLMNENVTNEELENAKLVFKNKMLNNNESVTDKTIQIVDGINSYYGIEQNNKAFEIVDTITAEDIRNAANYIFNQKPVLSILATSDTIENNKEYLKKFGEKIYM